MPTFYLHPTDPSAAPIGVTVTPPTLTVEHAGEIVDQFPDIADCIGKVRIVIDERTIFECVRIDGPKLILEWAEG